LVRAAPRVVRDGVVLDRNGLIGRRLLRAALTSLTAHSGAVQNQQQIAIVDLSRPSDRPRFFVLNLEDGSVRLMITTHGRGSDPDQIGKVVRVSNALGSLASSVGAYVTGDAYFSPTHLSPAVRLEGLDPTNSNARCRCIVMHEASRMDGQNYASAEWIRAHVGNDGRGQAGRSDGCFAFSMQDMTYVMSRMTPGTFVYAGPAKLPEFTPDPATVAQQACCPEASQAPSLTPPGAPAPAIPPSSSSPQPDRSPAAH
jgi:hypothetical protein